jgi:glycosyltransferase involved in cell wall biosynthesis
MSRGMSRISVIIPAFNEERLLGETLRQVLAAMTAFHARGWKTELIVCDNNSTDRTAEVARDAGARVVFEPINQIARARNAGASVAKGDWLVFVDADSHPCPELFEAVALQISGGRCLAGGATVRIATSSRLGKWGAAIWNWLSRMRQLMAGSFIFVEADAFREVGGFSHDLFAGEELDLSLKLRSLAKRSCRRIIILHQHPLLTSARKLHLYSRREMFWFFVKAALMPRRMLRSREHCHPWYDGRR